VIVEINNDPMVPGMRMITCVFGANDASKLVFHSRGPFYKKGSRRG